ncbi:hypothetical protein Ancab_026032 [Ancistrocladus abbreviatus]
MGLNSPLLSLDLNPPDAPQTISDILRHLSFSDENNSYNLSELDDCIRELQDELKKIEAFKRELPITPIILNAGFYLKFFSSDLPSDLHWFSRIHSLVLAVINYLKEGAKKCGEKELIPLKNNSEESRGVELETDPTDKKNWMSTAQLWSTSNHCSFLQLNSNNEGGVDRLESDSMYKACKYSDREGAIALFKKNSDVHPPLKDDTEKRTPPVLSLTIPSHKSPFSEPGKRRGITGAGDPTSAGGGVDEGVNGCSSHSTPCIDQVKTQLKSPKPPFPAARKQRRCWSPELHRRFLDALEKLGGSQVATPKQIRELMQVAGLTNDEVKSHLQKYRLHIRKLPASSPSSSNEIPPAQVQQIECSSKADTQQSGSPEGPLHLTIRSGNCCNSSATCADSIEEDQKSDGHDSWNVCHH